MRPRRTSPCLAATALSVALLLLILLHASSSPPLLAWPSSAAPAPPPPPPPRAERGAGRPPSFAYWISGTGGDGRRVLRLLRAVYHPRNRYLLHLDAGAGDGEREALAAAVRGEEPAWREFRNVDVVGDAYAVDRTGSSALAAVLHGAAVLLKMGPHWDWLVTLSAEDYPLVTQDDLLYAFSSVPRDLNFIDHTSDLGWKAHERFEKIIVDPSLYMDKNTELFLSKGTRQMPDAFQIFTVNADLRYFVWDDPPGLDPLVLNESNFQNMVNSSAAFARRFAEDAPVLKKMDDELLNRSPVQLVPGVWCPNLAKEQSGVSMESCLKWGDINAVRPGRAGERLRRFISEITETRGCS
nr:unnamed protein product [Digitaria exilis]